MSDHFYGMPARRRQLGNTLLRPSPAVVKTTFNAGYLVPIWDREMLPGETLEIDPSFIVRSQTPIHPVLDDAYLDVFCVYCPNRLVSDDWEKVMGGIKYDYWGDTTERIVPKITSASGVGFIQGSVADYFGLPIGVGGLEINSLPFRMYVLFWNEYVRDQNLMPPAACPTNGTDVTSPSSLGDPVLDAYKGGSLLPMCRMPDYFSTCTPGPLKATNVVSIGLPDVPIVQMPAPVMMSAPGVFSPSWLYESDHDIKPGLLSYLDAADRLRVKAASGEDPSGTGGEAVSSTPVNRDLFIGLQAATSTVGISINDFRFAVQLQKLLERDLFGTRYTEILKAHFGVTSQDSRLQRPELYGWRRFRLNQMQVAQTSATGSTGTPQANLAAYSLTCGKSSKWRILSPEHGHVQIYACVRVKHSYSQGVLRQWSRFSRYDFAWPEFVGLGNQPVYTKEIAVGLTGSDAVFGYQEYAADYRYNPRLVTGQMRPDASGTLASWHYGDLYTGNAPQLNATWIADHSKVLIDRTLAVTSAVSNQFFGEFSFSTELSTWLPMYSIPGFVDHF